MLETLKELLEEAQDNAESDPIWNYVEFIIKLIEEGEAWKTLKNKFVMTS